MTEPDEYVVKLKVYKRQMVAALWFVWIVGFLEIIEELHALHILPTVFNIY